MCVCCQIVQEVVSGQNVADVSGLAVIYINLVQRCATTDVAVHIILPSGTKANVPLLTSVQVITVRNNSILTMSFGFCVSAGI